MVITSPPLYTSESEASAISPFSPLTHMAPPYSTFKILTAWHTTSLGTVTHRKSDGSRNSEFPYALLLVPLGGHKYLFSLGRSWRVHCHWRAAVKQSRASKSQIWRGKELEISFYWTDKKDGAMGRFLRCWGDGSDTILLRILYLNIAWEVTYINLFLLCCTL